MTKEELEKEAKERANNCKHFSFVEGDVFNPEHKYKPMQKKEEVDNGQLSLFE